MSKLSRLIPIFKLQEDKCAARTAAAIKQRESLSNQLAQIKQYRAEYQNLDADVPVLLANARAFVERLDTSIADSEQRLETRQRSVDLEQQKWAAAKSRRKALEVLAAKEKKNTGNDVDAIAFWQVRCSKNEE